MQREFLHFADVDVFMNWGVVDHAGDTEKPQCCVTRTKAEDETQSGGLSVGLLQRRRGGVPEEGTFGLSFDA